MRPHRFPCVVSLVLLGPISTASAVDYFWQSSIGGAFDEFSNWSPIAPPGPGGANDTVNFDRGVSPENRYLVTDVGGQNVQLIVHNDSLELSVLVDYALLSTGGADPSLIVGAASGDAADLIFSGGAISELESRVTRIANDPGSTGKVTARGLQWNGGNLRVGHAGTGMLRIERDASVSSTNASLGHLPGSRGEAVMTSGQWTMSGDLLVGREGDGTLSVTGGVVRSVNASLGAEPSGEGIAFVSGQSANWTIDNVFTIGAAGDANVIVTGGHVISRDAIVGSVPASDGVVNVSDAGEWTTTGRLSIGGQTIGGTSGGSGLFRNSGGDVTVEGEVVISANGWFDFQGGTMAASTVTVEPGGHFMWTGGLFDVDEFNGNLNNQGGSLTSQHTQINGDYTQGGLGRLSISVLGDSASGMYDSVDVTGSANLGGTFEIPASNLYQPSAVDSYTVLRAADIIGSFNNAASGQRIANGNVSFIVYYGAGSPFNPDHVVLAEFLPVVLPGDFNEDGAVDAADYVVWRKNPGGMFTADDYDLWRANFGRLALGTVGSLIANEVTAPVPESETLWLLTIGLVWARLGRSRVAELANGATGKSVFVTIRGAVTTVKNRC